VTVEEVVVAVVVAVAAVVVEDAVVTVEVVDARELTAWSNPPTFKGFTS